MMTKNRFLIVGLVFSLMTVGPTVWAAAPNEGVVPDHYIIKLSPTARAETVASELARGLSLDLGHVYRHALNGFSARVPEARLAALARDPRVLSVVPDRYVGLFKPPCGTPPCGGGSDDSGSPPPAQSVPTGILRIDGDLSSTAAGDLTGTVDVDVAVIDTGIDTDHPDLNVVGGRNCSSGPRSRYDDGNGHGSHVAGTIGAIDNDFGVVGVAPGARLWAVRVLDNSGSGTWSSVICGVDWVTGKPEIEVANMSLGGTGPEGDCNDGGLHEAICNSVFAGITYAVAAGNSSDDAGNHVPAAYDEVITVSALADFDGIPGGTGSPTCRADVDDTFANFSNYGMDVDVIAPGVCIESTWKGGAYNTISGTSMASPHVAGAAALYLANNPGTAPADVKAVLAAAGNYDWSDSDDPDLIKEPLLNVSSF